MALTEEMQTQVDFQSAIDDARIAKEAAQHAKQIKMEAVRTAQNILFENRRVKMASDVVDITSQDIETLAEELVAYINS
tara:strand:- start:1995 stop:2231 length:237 start_codon:yes stop_codon:yes gene_type:complete